MACLETAIQIKFMFGYIRSHATECVFSNSFLKEVGFALKGDHVHPLEGVGHCRVWVDGG